MSIVIYEAGTRNLEGRYSKFTESNSADKVNKYIEIMKETVPDEFEIVFMEKFYELKCTTPRIIDRSK